MPLILCIAIGVILGPFVSLGSVAPVAGGLFLLFSSWEFNPRELFKDFKMTFWLSTGAFVIPFLAGYSLPYLLPQLFHLQSHMTKGAMALILGIAMSVSAVPVIIKILQELGWAGTERARRVLSTAILCDLVAWLLFIPLLPQSGRAGWVTSHATLLAFFVGVAIAFLFPKVTRKNLTLEKLNQWVVAPLLFFTIGQKLDFSHGFDVLQVVTIFAVATLSKTLGVWLASRAAKISKDESFAIALSLNARGAMEIIMASFALEAGLIDSKLFLSLVIMAIATSLLIKPVFRWRSLKDPSF